MDTIPLLLGVLTAGAAGFGAQVAARALPLMFHPDVRRVATVSGKAPGSLDSVLADPARDSSIIGLYQGALRYRDGAYGMGFQVELQPTTWAHDAVIEHRCNGLARMLTANKPAGTVVSFRTTTAPDPGQALGRHYQRIRTIRGNPGAQMLHALDLEHMANLAAAGNFRSIDSTCWIRVPVRQPSDGHRQGLAAFCDRLVGDLGRHGWGNLRQVLTAAWEQTRDDGLTRRLVEDEDAAFETAARLFRLLKRECPMSLTELSPQALFNLLYLEHNRNARSAPLVDETLATDMRAYLCAETLEHGGWYYLHGNRPVALISLFTPPQPKLDALCLRHLLLNRNLTMPHTLVSEFIHLDQDKAKKKLDTRVRQIKKASKKGNGRTEYSSEADQARLELKSVRDEMAQGTEALLQMRFYAHVLGQPATTKGELKASLRRLEDECEELVAALRRMPGADAQVEEPQSIKCLYPISLAGEADAKTTGREIEETASTLAPLIPTEAAWKGNSTPHTLLESCTGEMTGLDLFSSEVVMSPVVLALGNMGAGKSVIMGDLAIDVLACYPQARVLAVDFGESFGPVVDVVGGRHMRYVSDCNRAPNIWCYPGLELGQMADDHQMQLVVGDLLHLAGLRESNPNYEISERVLKLGVRAVYETVVPRNAPGLPRYEPTLSHILDMLGRLPYKSAIAKSTADNLALLLEDFRNNPWLDRPQPPEFDDVGSPFDVFELDSLNGFSKDLKGAIAYRTAALLMQSIGRLLPDGTRAPTLLIFDEVHKYKTEAPQLLGPASKGSRQGRTNKVVTMFGTHAFEDLEDLLGVVRNAGYKIIGQQLGDISPLVREMKLSPAAEEAIRSIHNVPGSHAQYVLSIGSGSRQIVQKVQRRLTGTKLWLRSSQPDERDARDYVRRKRPDWTSLQVAQFLTEHYPQGLALIGLKKINPRLVPELSPSDMLLAEQDLMA